MVRRLDEATGIVAATVEFLARDHRDSDRVVRGAQLFNLDEVGQINDPLADPK